MIHPVIVFKKGDYYNAKFPLFYLSP